MSEQWFLNRDNEQYGPYTWEEILDYLRIGRIGPEDLLWNQSMNSWIKVRHIPQLKAVMKSGKSPGGRKKFLWLIAPAAAVIILLVVLLTSGSNISIEDHFPRSGVPGSPVALKFEKDISGVENLKAFYNDEEILLSDIFEDTAMVMIPANARAGRIHVSAGSKKSNAVEFGLAQTKITLLHEEQVSPAAGDQIINYREEIIITIPEGILDQPRNLSISLVENAPANTLAPPGNSMAIDVSIEGLAQLEDYIEISFRYDPAALNSAYSAYDQLVAMRWDEETGSWGALHYWVDEENETIHMLTDHLSFFAIPSMAAVGGTVLKTGVAIATVAATGWVVEKICLYSYTTPQGNFKILYQKKLMDVLYGGSKWTKPDRAAGISDYSSKHPPYIQDIGELLEAALANYCGVRKFKNPTVTPGYLWGERRTPLTVKMGGLWGMGTGLMAGYESPQYGKVFGAIHLPTAMFREVGLSEIYANIGHELFHAIQSQYYSRASFLQWTGSKSYWWLESTAEYAGCREAWQTKELDDVLQRGLGADFLAYPLNSTGINPGFGRDHEYASAGFLIYLVDVIGLDFKELVEFVAAGEPLARLDDYIKRSDPLGLFYCYQKFAAWTVFSGNSFLARYKPADFSPDAQGKGDIAERKDLLSIPEKSSLEISISGADSESTLNIFRMKGTERINENIIHPLDMLSSFSDETTLDDLQMGEVIYLLAVNCSDQDQSLTAVMKYQQEGQDVELTHTFDLKGNYSARLWAVKIGEITLKITPEEIKDGKAGEDYSFELEAAGLPANLTTVAFNWDFGDGEDEDEANLSAGRVNAPVEKGKAAATISHKYILPGNYTLKVVLTDDKGANLADAQADVVLEGVQVRITGGSKSFSLGGGPQDYYEYTHEFEAIAIPADKVSYIFEWDFGNGESLTQEGETANTSFTYINIKPGDVFRPTVTLYTGDHKGPLAEDSITFSFALDETAQGEVIFFEMEESTHFAHEYLFLVQYRMIDPEGVLVWDFGDGSEPYRTYAKDGRSTDIRPDIKLKPGYVLQSIYHDYYSAPEEDDREYRFTPTIKMYDSQGRLLGEHSMTITVERCGTYYVDPRIPPGADW